MVMDLKEQFETAVADSKLLPARPDTDTLLTLYSFFKQATEGNAPPDAPSNPFDIVARAKYLGWEWLFGLDADPARRIYIELVNKLTG